MTYLLHAKLKITLHDAGSICLVFSNKLPFSEKYILQKKFQDLLQKTGWWVAFVLNSDIFAKIWQKCGINDDCVVQIPK